RVPAGLRRRPHDVRGPREPGDPAEAGAAAAAAPGRGAAVAARVHPAGLPRSQRRFDAERSAGVGVSPVPAATRRAIIVAAGMGRRLAPYTDDRPKCLVEVNGRTILERQIDAYRAAGVDDICVVRGYLAERIAFPDLRYFENPDFARNNILASLFYA